MHILDDAHSMSIHGQNGRGYVLANRSIHKKMILVSSMAKAFATGSGIIVLPNKELARRVRICGSPFNSSGPLQPATLGAAIASARIHLTNEIYILQEELSRRIEYVNKLIKNSSLPMISRSNAGIFFIGTSKAEIAFQILEKMIQQGYLLNIGVYPAVSKNHSGIRFTITTLQSYKQIEKMIASLQVAFTETLNIHGISLQQIWNAFKAVRGEACKVRNNIRSSF